jgi:WD40 repeat protein
MEGRGIADRRAQIPRMQEGVRQWVRKHGASLRGGGAHAGAGNGTRRLPPLALLAALTASACCPLFTVGAGALTLAGAGVISAMGTGVLSGLLASAVDRARERGSRPSPPELEDAVATQIRAALKAGDDRAQQLRADIAMMLREIDAGGVAVRAVMESGDAELGRDIVTALGDIGDGFSELRFLMQDVAQTGLSIRQALDEQGADVRTVIDQNYRQATSIRLILDTVRAIEARIRTPVSWPGGGDGTSPAVGWTRGCPYRGLLPFGEDDTDVFYGRELLTAELTALAARQIRSGGMVVVTGASGAGKSSLLRAGLLPALARGEAGAGSQEWARFVITPGEAPLDRLTAPIEALGGGHRRGSLRGVLADYPAEAAAVLRQAVEVDLLSRRREVRNGGRMVLIVDQFEQLFTLNPGPEGEAERQAFIAALCTMGTGSASPGGVPPAFVVIGVRGDFWARCAEYPLLTPHLRDGQFVVGPMTEPELRLAITGPAGAAGLRIEEALPDTIVRDLRTARACSGAGSGADNAGVLPLLSEAMRQTWENREGNCLTSRGYARAGGVSQAVRNRADAVYDALPEPRQAIAREILLRMTVAGQDGEFARRPADRAELYAGHAAEDVDAVLEALADARLIILDQQAVSISHDVLLHAWPRLRGWLERDRGALLLHGQLAEDSAAWNSHEADTSYLYRGAQLAGVREAAAIWASDPGRYPPLTDQQRDFLSASEHAQTRQARRRRAAVVTLAILLIVSVVSAGVAGLAAHAQRTAAQAAVLQASQALSGELAAESEQLDAADPVTAAQLAAASWRIAPTPQANHSMLAVLAQPERAAITATRGKLPITAMASARQGHMLITAGADGMVRLWDVGTRRELGSPLAVFHSPGNRTGAINRLAMALSPLGTVIATAGDDGGVKMWNLTSRREMGPRLGPTGFDGIAIALAFSPDGSMLAVVGGDGTVRLWNVATRKAADLPVSTAAGTVVTSSVTFSPDGKMLAIGVGGTLELWNVATGREVAGPVTAVDAADALVGDLAFSPDGKTLATGGGDGKLRLWHIPSLRQIGTPIVIGRGPEPNSVTAVGFSPDGRAVAAGDTGGTVRLWDLTTHRQIGPSFAASSGVAGGDSDINAIFFSADGTTLATAGNDGIIRLWDLDVYQEVGSPIAVTGTAVDYMHAVAFSPDGKLLATEVNGTVRLWDVDSHRQVGKALADPSVDNTVAFSPDGRILATADADGKVRLWSVATHKQISPPIGNAGNNNLISMAFSPSGAILATGDQDGKARLWSVTTRRLIGRALTAANGGKIGVLTVAFSPDGRVLATGSGDGQARLWRVATHRQIGQSINVVSSSAAGSGIDALAFNPASSILATADGDGTARLWNAATDREIGPPISVSHAGGDMLTAIAFTRSGSILITGDGNGAARLWDVATFQEIGPAITPPGSLNGILGLAVSPNGEILATVGTAEGAAQLWNIAFPTNLSRAVCAIAGSSLTPGEWNSYIQSRPYQKVC